MSVFTKAVRSRRKLRAAFDGPPGSGKTYTALRLAFSLVAADMAKRVAIIDTENESASLYAGEAPDGMLWEFDTLNLKKFGPDDFTHAINTAAKEGYDAIVVDSLSHAWVGEGGALDLVDSKGGNKFTAWKDVTPMHRRMVDTLTRSPAHIITTMRSKVEYVIEEDQNGRKVPVKKGMAPIQRDGMEYEMDLFGSCDWSHQIRISKTRCSMMDGATTVKAGPAFWAPLFDWLKAAFVPGPRVSELEAAIRAAETGDALKALGADVKAAKDSGAISDTESNYLRPIFEGRARDLKQPR